MLAKLYYYTLRILLLYATTDVCIFASNDPYAALGINSLATTQEIRKAYKQMAKEWHPDKNQVPGAEEKFVEIKKSYELLSDSNRRRIYDRHGVIDEDSHYLQQKHDYSGYDRFASDQAEDIFGKHFIIDQDIVLYHKLSVTANYFENTILIKSAKQLHIIMFYNDWCFQCTRLVGAFKKLIDVLEPLGIYFSTINAAHEPSILQKTGANEIPKMILVLNGQVFVYRDYSFTPQKVVEFIRKKMPYKIVQRVYDDNIDVFLNGWMDNRVRVLILEPRSLIRLRYLLTAFSFYDRVAFGFVDLTKKSSQSIIDRFKVNPSLDTLLLFNEDSTRSIARISLPDISTQILTNMITPNQFLTLPRLSSQDMLESVCPAEWNRPRKRLCVILITENSDEHNLARSAMREIALHSRYSVERVRFAYMFKERQPNFINALSKGSFAKNLLQIVIIWRRDNTRVKYEWVFDAKQDATLISTLPTESIINKTKKGLTHKIQKLLKASEALSYESFCSGNKLLDEHSQGIFSKWITHLLYLVDYLSENLEDEHLFAAFSLLGTIGFMFGVGYILMYFVRAEEEQLKAQGHLANVTTLFWIIGASHLISSQQFQAQKEESDFSVSGHYWMLSYRAFKNPVALAGVMAPLIESGIVSQQQLNNMAAREGSKGSSTGG
ncbi:dnaJ homolog subfamily C member 16, partial [Drosophila obscura]|uniref:dnaJ homolog subfamily C member 16 n=1 Tax=Drosophila obscura TaxID=7282 RepID=UPI001BB16FF9